jgi:uncharacterized cupredoxin-like copper-binding protein
MSLKTTIATTAVTALLLTGCSFFEVAEHNMPEGHGEEHGAQHEDADEAMGHDERAHAHDHGEDTPAIEGAPETRITGDAMAFEPASLELAVGEEHNLTLYSVDILHDLTIDEIDFHVAADAGEEATGGVVFEEPGTYLAYCAVPGHRQAGMEIEITVR